MPFTKCAWLCMGSTMHKYVYVDNNYLKQNISCHLFQKSTALMFAIFYHPLDIIFTSGGTEGNNMVLHSAVQHFWLCHPLADGRTQMRGTNSPRQEVDEKKYDPEDGLRPHFVTSNIEHDSISKVLQTFEANGLAGLDDVPEGTSQLL